MWYSVVRDTAPGSRANLTAIWTRSQATSYISDSVTTVPNTWRCLSIPAFLSPRVHVCPPTGGEGAWGVCLRLSSIVYSLSVVVHQTKHIKSKYDQSAACSPPPRPRGGLEGREEEAGARTAVGDVYFAVSHYSAISSVLSREKPRLKKISSLQLSYKLN